MSPRLRLLGQAMRSHAVLDGHSGEARGIPALVGALVMASIVSCSRPKTEGPAPSASAAAPSSSTSAVEGPHAHVPKRIALSAKVIADAGIKTMPVAREPLMPTVDLPGAIAADPDRSARVSPPVAGRLEQIFFHEGSQVKRGDPLAMLRVPDLGKARAAYAGTSAKAGAARTNAGRLSSLAERGLASTQEALSARAEADALEAEARAAEQQLNALGMGKSGDQALLALRAPIAGVVIRRNAVVGQPVATDETIATIADLSDVWFLARVFERDLEHVHVGARAQVLLNAYASERFEGPVEYLGKEVDPVARTILARIRLTNRNDLIRIGLFGTARLDRGDASTRPPVVVVPRDALTDVLDNPVVFVRLTSPENTFEMREVRAGPSSAQKVEILDGVKEREEVVTEGIFTVKSAFMKATFAEEE